MKDGRDEKGRFTKGNPGGVGSPGRPPSEFSVTAILKLELEKRPEIVAKLLDLAVDEDKNVALKALTYILNRVEGMPKQATELSGPDNGPVKLTWSDGSDA